MSLYFDIVGMSPFMFLLFCRWKNMCYDARKLPGSTCWTGPKLECQTAKVM